MADKTYPPAAMVYKYAHPDLAIRRDGKPWAKVERADELRGIIRLDARILEYAVYGPFDQGYSIGLFARGVEIETLIYEWREGAVLHPEPPELTLRFHEGVLSREEQDLGKAAVTSQAAEMVITVPVAPLAEEAIALLCILDAQWSRRVLLFARG